MSNALAIAAVTATMRNVLFQGVSSVLAGTQVTARPPDRARTDITGNQLNLFLYRTSIEAAWRNQDMPSQSKPGELGHPPLPLTLHYLITAYSDADDEVLGNQLIGRAVSLFHDRPLLDRTSIESALPGNDLHEQVERVRLTSSQLTDDELFRLWSAFQTEYRLSVAYEASVVLIESTRPPAAPLPVAQRGDGDGGPVAQGDTESPFPSLSRAQPPQGQPVALPGDELVLSGQRLAGATVEVRFRHPRLPAPVVVANPAATEGELRVPVPAGLPAGYATVAVIVTDGDGVERATNELPVGIAPRIANAPLAAARNGAGVVTLDVDVVPDVLPGQAASLIVGSRQVAAPARNAPASTLTFSAPLDAGGHPVRVRVDGVDSLLIDHSASPPSFDPDQRLEVT